MSRSTIRNIPLHVLLLLGLQGALFAADAGEAGDAVDSLRSYASVVERFGLDTDPAAEPAAAVAAYVALAVSRNVGIKAALADVSAALARAPQASALPEPRLGLTHYLQSVETRVGPQQRAFSISQSFPWFGTLSLKGDVERRRAAAMQAGLDETILEVMAQAASAYHEIGYLEEAIAITGRHIGLLTQWESIARARYEADAGLYADVIKSQVELGVLGDRLRELVDRRRPLVAMLNALLDRPADAVVEATLPATFTIGEIDRDALVERMLAANPRLLAWDHRAEAAAAGEKLAGKTGLPSFSLGLNYIQTGRSRFDGVPDSGTDAVTASLSVNLPIWRGKYDAASREAAGRFRSARASRREAQNRLVAELERALFDYRDAGRKWDLYATTLLPKARQSLGAVRAAYEAGESGFLDVIDAERLLLEFELSRARALADALVREARIEQLTAVPFSGTDPHTQPQ